MPDQPNETRKPPPVFSRKVPVHKLVRLDNSDLWLLEKLEEKPDLTSSALGQFAQDMNYYKVPRRSRGASGSWAAGRLLKLAFLGLVERWEGGPAFTYRTTENWQALLKKQQSS